MVAQGDFCFSDVAKENLVEEGEVEDLFDGFDAVVDTEAVVDLVGGDDADGDIEVGEFD